jgi:hypothetical protein
MSSNDLIRRAGGPVVKANGSASTVLSESGGLGSMNGAAVILIETTAGVSASVGQLSN